MKKNKLKRELNNKITNQNQITMSLKYYNIACEHKKRKKSTIIAG